MEQTQTQTQPHWVQRTHIFKGPHWSKAGVEKLVQAQCPDRPFNSGDRIKLGDVYVRAQGIVETRTGRPTVRWRNL